MSKIKLEAVTISIGATKILENLSWSLETGEHWVISGNNGTGKTVLAEAISGNHRISTGSRSYPFLGVNPTYEVRRAAIRMISFMDTSKLFKDINDVHYYQQRFNAWDSDGHLTARQYLEADGADLAEHEDLLKSIDIWELLDLDRIKLSSGQTRKLLLAKVMLQAPEILIIDNPYDGLDGPSRILLNQLLDELVASSGMNLILVGHYRQLPSCISHQLLINQDGGTTQGRISQLEQLHVGKKIDKKIVGQLTACFQELYRHETFESIIKFEDVNIRYGKAQILEDLNWNVRGGEKWAVIGQNGSGKSTVLSLIYADAPQGYGNRIFLFDRRLGDGHSIWEVKKRIGFTSPELHAYFDEDLTMREVIETGQSDTFSILKGASELQLQLLHLFLVYFDCEKYEHMSFKQLSTGIQRLTLFMRALIKSPALLLLDEPFQGLDTDTVRHCKYLLDHILDEKQTLLFISHFPEEIPSCVTQELHL